MKSLCSGRDGKPRKHEQRLLRNLGAHNVIFQLLQIPYDKVRVIQYTPFAWKTISQSSSGLRF